MAWWRTGFTAFAVSLGTAKVVPALTHGARWPYTVLGAAFALLGTAFVGYGLIRQRAVDAALKRGEFTEPGRRTILGLAAIGVVLGIGLFILVAKG
jgi:uncharacterized membrane protein YidH (DUF202 family)